MLFLRLNFGNPLWFYQFVSWPSNREANNIIGLYLHLITGLFCAFYQRFLLKGWKLNYSVCSLLYQFGAAAKGEFDLDELLETRK